MKIFTTILLLNFFAIAAISQNLQWAKVMGGTGIDYGLSVAVDAAGNVYTTGNFVGTVDFDPGIGVFNLTSAGKNDFFISKFDEFGNFQWARCFGDTADDVGYGICSDASGNVFITGFFTRNVDFDPGPATYTAAAGIRGDIFILKLNTSGNLVWVKTFAGDVSADGSNLSDNGQAITLDASGNLYTTGRFQRTVDFDPGAGIFNVTCPNNSPGTFVLKLDVSGNFVWVSGAAGFSGPGGGGGTIDAFSTAVDAAQNVYTTGKFIGNYDFDAGPATYTLNTNFNYGSYVCKYDASGNFVWVKEFKSNSGIYAFALTLDNSANIYVTGFFQGTTDLDPSPAVFNLNSVNGSSDIFLTKLDSAGNFKWAKRIGGTGHEGGFSITHDNFEQIYLAGAYQSTVDFNPGNPVYNLASAGDNDEFILKLDTAGAFIWAISSGGTGPDLAYAIAIDGLSNILTTGSFSNTCDFDPGQAVSNLTATGGTDIFVTKLGSCSIAFSSQPINQLSAIGTTAQFVTTASANSTLFQWQQNTGSGFNNLANAGQYSGVTTASLTISNVTLGQNGYTFRCIVSESACINSSGSAVLTVYDATAINEKNNENFFTIYPNPSNECVTIKTNGDEIYSYQVIDQIGRQVLRGKSTGLETRLNVSFLAPALYFISIDGKNKKPVKFVKE